MFVLAVSFILSVSSIESKVVPIKSFDVKRVEFRPENQLSNHVKPIWHRGKKLPLEHDTTSDKERVVGKNGESEGGLTKLQMGQEERYSVDSEMTEQKLVKRASSPGWLHDMKQKLPHIVARNKTPARGQKKKVSISPVVMKTPRREHDASQRRNIRFKKRVYRQELIIKGSNFKTLPWAKTIERPPFSKHTSVETEERKESHPAKESNFKFLSLIFPWRFVRSKHHQNTGSHEARDEKVHKSETPIRGKSTRSTSPKRVPSTGSSKYKYQEIPPGLTPASPVHRLRDPNPTKARTPFGPFSSRNRSFEEYTTQAISSDGENDPTPSALIHQWYGERFKDSAAPAPKDRIPTIPYYADPHILSTTVDGKIGFISGEEETTATPTSSSEAEPAGISEAKPTSSRESEISSPGRSRPTSPHRTNPNSPVKKTKPTSPHRTNPNSPVKKTKPTSPRRTNPTSPIRTIPTSPIRTKSTSPERAKLTSPGRYRPTSPKKAIPTSLDRAKLTSPKRAKRTSPDRPVSGSSHSKAIPKTVIPVNLELYLEGNVKGAAVGLDELENYSTSKLSNEEINAMWRDTERKHHQWTTTESEHISSVKKLENPRLKLADVLLQSEDELDEEELHSMQAIEGKPLLRRPSTSFEEHMDELDQRRKQMLSAETESPS